MNLANGRYGEIDLSSGETQEHNLEEDFARSPTAFLSRIDAAIADAGEDAIAISSGILTGSLVPAAGAGFLRLARDGSEAERMCPLLGFVGVELKLSGFDFIVISGKASEHGYIWIRDGIIEFVSSPDSAALDSWGRTDLIRSQQGDGRIQVIAAGSWAESQPPSSQLIFNYWGGEDKLGCAGEFGSRKLTAVAFRGMGELDLEDSEGHFAASSELYGKQLADLGENRGFASFSSAAEHEGYSELLHRNIACYGCPFPCRSFYKLFEDASVKERGAQEPGYLVYDIASVEYLTSLGLSSRDVVTVLMWCARFGAEPMSVAAAVSAGGAVDIAAIQSALESGGAGSSANSILSHGFADSFEDVDDYATCLALGLCPRYWAKVGLDLEAIGRVSEPALGAPINIVD